MYKRNKNIKLVSRSSKTVEVSRKDVTIITVGSDFILLVNRKQYALDFSEEKRISISHMSQLLSLNWISLFEFITDDECGDCDGYDYSNCDYSRCKNDCEKCGGRRYICNNGCFYNRYKTAVRISCNADTIVEYLKEAKEIILETIKPFPIGNLYEQYKDQLESLYNDVALTYNYIELDYDTYFEVKDFMESYQIMKDKIYYRNSRDNNRIKVIVKLSDSYESYILPKECISLRNKGFLFWKRCMLIIKGYDYNSDEFIKKEFELSKDDYVIENAIKQNNICLRLRKNDASKWNLEFEKF